jgi:hypothetical protein
MAQACHATREFGQQCPDADVGDNLVVLHAPDERTLRALMLDAECERWPVVGFCEPDLRDELTAVAFGGAAARMLRKLPLALRAA